MVRFMGWMRSYGGTILDLRYDEHYVHALLWNYNFLPQNLQ